MTTPQDEADVQLFKDFLRINTMHPKPDLTTCVAWLKDRAAEQRMQFRTFTFVEGLPIVVLTKVGEDASLPALGLNCHMDVVPVVAEMWTDLPKGETPFTAWEDPKNGRIYARGSQDMKCVGAQYLCALRRLGADRTYLRTIHLVWVPDEEIGGVDGMAKFVTSADFRSLNVGCMMDEGLADPDNRWIVYYGERASMKVHFECEGPMGHGSVLVDNTATERLVRVCERLRAFREINRKLLDEGKLLGDVTTVNFTVFKAGVTNDGGKTYAINVIPRTAEVYVDCRIPNGQFQQTIDFMKQVAKECDATLTLPPQVIPPTKSPDGLWWPRIESSLGKWGIPVTKEIFPAATDSRYVRHVGVPSFGFSPMRKTPRLLHDHNEFLPRATYLEGVAVYMDLIPTLANTPAPARL